MKNLINNTTIQQAIELGFDFNDYSFDFSLQEIHEELVDFFNDNADRLPQVEDECEVESAGYTQTVNYKDYSCSGEIVDFSRNWGKAPDTKVYHSSFVFQDKDNIVKQMNLYYLVGETEYNGPEGYVFVNGKGHVKIEE